MDSFAEIGVFTRVVDAHSFTRAGRSLGMTPSGVSRVITRLERRLGVRLMQRTTRSLSLTDHGAAYYQRCKQILRELDDAESHLARATQAPRGRLRVDAPVVLGRYVLGPTLPGLLAAHPELAIDLSVRDHVIDPIAEGIDVTLRMAELRDTELASRNLGAMRMVFAAAPRYLAQHGRPRHPSDLGHHELIGFWAGGSSVLPWQFKSGERRDASGRLTTNSADVRRDAAIAGVGVVHMFAFHIADELAKGQLELVLTDHEPPPKPVHALFAGARAATPKVRVFLDWAAELIKTCADLPKKRARRAARSMSDSAGSRRPNREP